MKEGSKEDEAPKQKLQADEGKVIAPKLPKRHLIEPDGEALNPQFKDGRRDSAKNLPKPQKLRRGKKSFFHKV